MKFISFLNYSGTHYGEEPNLLSLPPSAATWDRIYTSFMPLYYDNPSTTLGGSLYLTRDGGIHLPSDFTRDITSFDYIKMYFDFLEADICPTDPGSCGTWADLEIEACSDRLSRIIDNRYNSFLDHVSVDIFRRTASSTSTSLSSFSFVSSTSYDINVTSIPSQTLSDASYDYFVRLRHDNSNSFLAEVHGFGSFSGVVKPGSSSPEHHPDSYDIEGSSGDGSWMSKGPNDSNYMRVYKTKLADGTYQKISSSDRIDLKVYTRPLNTLTGSWTLAQTINFFDTDDDLLGGYTSKDYKFVLENSPCQAGYWYITKPSGNVISGNSAQFSIKTNTSGPYEYTKLRVHIHFNYGEEVITSSEGGVISNYNEDVTFTIGNASSCTDTDGERTFNATFTIDDEDLEKEAIIYLYEDLPSGHTVEYSEHVTIEGVDH